LFRSWALDPIDITVTIKAVPREPAVTRPKLLIAVPCEISFLCSALIPAVFNGIINNETENILNAYTIMRYIYEVSAFKKHNMIENIVNKLNPVIINGLVPYLS